MLREYLVRKEIIISLKNRVEKVQEGGGGTSLSKLWYVLTSMVFDMFGPKYIIIWV